MGPVSFSMASMSESTSPSLPGGAANCIPQGRLFASMPRGKAPTAVTSTLAQKPCLLACHELTFEDFSSLLSLSNDLIATDCR